MKNTSGENQVKQEQINKVYEENQCSQNIDCSAESYSQTVKQKLQNEINFKQIEINNLKALQDMLPTNMNDAQASAINFLLQ